MSKVKKTKVNGVKVYCTEEYASELLDLYMNDESFNFDLEPEVGKTLKGKLVGRNGNYVVVDIGYKDYVMVEMRSNELLTLNRLNKTDGDEVNVLVTEVQDNPYMLKGSFAALLKQEVLSAMNEGSNLPYEAFVKESTPAGYILDLLSHGVKIPAFMPNTLSGINKLHNPLAIVGKTLTVSIESFDSTKGTFIASRKKYLQSLIPATIAELRNVDDEGNPIPYRGVVTGSISFGVFVEFNECLTGMIHKINLGEEALAEITTIVPGTEINFFIKEIVKGKLILTQVWRTTTWDTIKKDDCFEGIVKDVKKTGTLVLLDDETVGMIHANELERGKRRVKEGDSLTVRVSMVNRMERKIYLTLA